MITSLEKAHTPQTQSTIPLSNTVVPPEGKQPEATPRPGGGDRLGRAAAEQSAWPPVTSQEAFSEWREGQMVCDANAFA